MTKHEIITGNSNKMSTIPDGLVNLIVTSPPYPMIEMWDEMFGLQNSDIQKDLENGEGYSAFLKMHSVLNTIGRNATEFLPIMGLYAST